jgi:hypothetical protein
LFQTHCFHHLYLGYNKAIYLFTTELYKKEGSSRQCQTRSANEIAHDIAYWWRITRSLHENSTFDYGVGLAPPHAAFLVHRARPDLWERKSFSAEFDKLACEIVETLQSFGVPWNIVNSPIMIVSETQFDQLLQRIDHCSPRSPEIEEVPKNAGMIRIEDWLLEQHRIVSSTLNPSSSESFSNLGFERAVRILRAEAIEESVDPYGCVSIGDQVIRKVRTH